MSLFQELQAVSKPKREEVEVPEWEDALKGRKIYLQQMSAPDRDAWEREGLKKIGDRWEDDWDNVRSRLISRCLVDEDGNKVFPNSDSMREIVHTITTPLYTKARKINCLDKESLEDSAKNSEGGQSADSG